LVEDMATHYSVENAGASEEATSSRPAAGAVLLGALVAAGPAAFTVYLAFRSGGYFAGAPAIAAIALAIALVLRLMLADSPFEGFGPALTWAAIGLGAFTLWTLLSAFWSHAPAQALLSFDRSLMLWLALVLFGSFRWSRERLLWAVRILAAAMVVVAILGLITRLLPNVHEVPETFERDRLSYPISYWNGLGVFVAAAIVLCCGLATRREEPPLGKILAAAAIPILGTTLYFTFSRGATGALLLGLIAFVALTARRELLTSFVAIVPPTVVAVLLGIGTHTLSTEHYAAPAGVSEGHKLAWEVLACAAAAGALRALLVPVDRRLAAIELSPTFRRRGWIVVGAVVAVAVVGVGVAASGRIGEDFEKFTETRGIEDKGELQHRFTDVNNNGRIAQWKLAIHRFGAEPVLGDGAGTFARSWAAEGADESRIVDSHSLYLGVLAELGLPGLIFLLAALIAILAATARRIFGPERILYAAIFAAMLTWALHASVDWDWQLPALGFFVFSLGALAISSDRGGDDGWTARLGGRTARIALSLCALALVVSPALMAISQGYLNTAVRDFDEGNCAGASRQALNAIHTLSVRPEPYQLLGFCDSREGENALAITMLETAIERDRGEWESYYGLALVQAAAGEDPRAAARKAYEMAPHEPLAEEGNELFTSGNPRAWKRRAQRARHPVSGSFEPGSVPGGGLVAGLESEHRADDDQAETDDQQWDGKEAGEGEAAAFADDGLLFGRGRGDFDFRSRFGAVFGALDAVFAAGATVAAVAPVGAAVTAVAAVTGAAFAPVLAALFFDPLDFMFGVMFTGARRLVLAGGGAAAAGAARDGEPDAGRAQHESGHQHQRESESRLHERSLLEARSRSLGLADRLQLDPVELQGRGLMPFGLQGILDCFELGRGAVAVRVVHLLAYTKHNVISQLEFPKG
jgi:hypothetical protein